MTAPGAGAGRIRWVVTSALLAAAVLHAGQVTVFKSGSDLVTVDVSVRAVRDSRAKGVLRWVSVAARAQMAMA